MNQLDSASRGQTRAPFLLLATAISLVMCSACSSIHSAGSTLDEQPLTQASPTTAVQDVQWLDFRLISVVGEASADELNGEIGSELRRSSPQRLASSTTWRDVSGKASAIIETVPVRGEAKVASRKTVKEVIFAPQLTRRHGVYETMSRSNIRFGPGTDYPVVKTVDIGMHVKVVAQSDNQWFLLEQKDTIIGYMHASLLKPSAISTAARSDEIVDLKSMGRQRVDLAMAEQCRRVKIRATGTRGAIDESYTACIGSDGRWRRYS